MEVLVAPTSNTAVLTASSTKGPNAVSAPSDGVMWQLQAQTRLAAHNQKLTPSSLFNEKAAIPSELFTALHHPTFVVLQYHLTTLTFATTSYYPQQQNKNSRQQMGTAGGREGMDFPTGQSETKLPHILVSPAAFFNLFQHSAQEIAKKSTVGGAQQQQSPLEGKCLLTIHVAAPSAAKAVTFGVEQPVGCNTNYSELMHHYIAPFFLDHQRVLTLNEEFCVEGSFGCMRLTVLRTEPSGNTCVLMEETSRVTLLTNPQSAPVLHRSNPGGPQLETIFQHQQTPLISQPHSLFPPRGKAASSPRSSSASPPTSSMRNTVAEDPQYPVGNTKSNNVHRRWLKDEPITNNRGSAPQYPIQQEWGNERIRYAPPPTFEQQRTPVPNLQPAVTPASVPMANMAPVGNQQQQFTPSAVGPSSVAVDPSVIHHFHHHHQVGEIEEITKTPNGPNIIQPSPQPTQQGGLSQTPPVSLPVFVNPENPASFYQPLSRPSQYYPQASSHGGQWSQQSSPSPDRLPQQGPYPFAHQTVDGNVVVNAVPKVATAQQVNVPHHQLPTADPNILPTTVPQQQYQQYRNNVSPSRILREQLMYNPTNNATTAGSLVPSTPLQNAVVAIPIYLSGDAQQQRRSQSPIMAPATTQHWNLQKQQTPQNTKQERELALLHRELDMKNKLREMEAQRLEEEGRKRSYDTLWEEAAAWWEHQCHQTKCLFPFKDIAQLDSEIKKFRMQTEILATAHNDLRSYLTIKDVSQQHSRHHVSILVLKYPLQAPLHPISLALEKQGVMVENTWRAQCTGTVYVTHVPSSRYDALQVVMGGRVLVDVPKTAMETAEQKVTAANTTATGAGQGISSSNNAGGSTATIACEVIAPNHTIADDLVRVREFEYRKWAKLKDLFDQISDNKHFLSTSGAYATNSAAMVGNKWGSKTEGSVVQGTPSSKMEAARKELNSSMIHGPSLPMGGGLSRSPSSRGERREMLYPEEATKLGSGGGIHRNFLSLLEERCQQIRSLYHHMKDDIIRQKEEGNSTSSSQRNTDFQFVLAPFQATTRGRGDEVRASDLVHQNTIHKIKELEQAMQEYRIDSEAALYKTSQEESAVDPLYNPEMQREIELRLQAVQQQVLDEMAITAQEKEERRLIDQHGASTFSPLPHTSQIHAQQNLFSGGKKKILQKKFVSPLLYRTVKQEYVRVFSVLVFFREQLQSPIIQALSSYCGTIPKQLSDYLNLSRNNAEKMTVAAVQKPSSILKYVMSTSTRAGDPLMTASNMDVLNDTTTRDSLDLLLQQTNELTAGAMTPPSANSAETRAYLNLDEEERVWQRLCRDALSLFPKMDASQWVVAAPTTEDFVESTTGGVFLK